MNSKPLISEEQIKEFMKIYEEEIGEEISIQEAYDKGFKLVSLMALCLYRIPVKKLQGELLNNGKESHERYK